ncbi:hypothetical protein [Thermostaphylospora chromogena]|uniref:Uncharacterized protein n=1 Tax=Thermostaphylospora chromogena TaxID=35622 RepID=A0A1H1F121_9ACTN|nr:hypothetical protein [Thermostaphylospora chromogena]SDQ94136.1 hypothetical protein SAMN04489764_2707 [Thermostaphylospora chromogena]
MFVDPPAPRPLDPRETPPKGSTDPLSPDAGRSWEFNPEYQRLVTLWQQVLPLLDDLTASLDKALRLARSPDTWDAPVGRRYVEDLTEWRERLQRYRRAVLTAISDEAADTPRWIPVETGAPHAFN